MNSQSNFPEHANAPSASLPATTVLSGTQSAEAEACLEQGRGVDGGEGQLADVIDLLRTSPEALAQVVGQLCPDDVRSDGWTPFARRLFLSVLAESGRVTLACEYARLSKQSAYALRARDPLFAAGWDAACEIARALLADALYERALDGTVETITRDGEVVAERHRHDSRLSIAVLHRLDKRCDRAADTGSHHLALVAHWEDWLRLVGKGEEQAARALLQNPPHSQLGQLPLGENPIADARNDDGDDDGLDLSDRCWKDGIEDIWLTDFPPPEGFSGYESRPYDEDCDERYQRACTPEEIAILEDDAAGLRAAERAEDEALRDAWFALLKPPGTRESTSAPGADEALHD